MSEEDKELELLKKRRLAEMEKNIAFKKMQEHKPSTDLQSNPREILVKNLGYRGLEVLNNAESQYPAETKIIIDKLAELLSSGEIDEEIDGGKLLALFRSVGINVRMQTKINIEQDGKFVSLSEKLTSKSSNNETFTEDVLDNQ
jgi:DNA-binding TFAR19-related protein (PDSD5 family)